MHRRHDALRLRARVLAPLVTVVAAALAGQSLAFAASNSVSTVYKTGIDATSGDSAASPGTPGLPDGKVADTFEGRTIKWVVSYQNNTSDVASVNLKDPLTAAGTYVPGSLQLPPGLAAQYTTNGSSWTTGSPPATATGVGGIGSLPPGTQQLTTFPRANSFSVITQAGDGYNAVTSPGGAQIYVAFHHNNTNQVVACATAAAAQCPGWPAPATYVSPEPGFPIGTGPNGMTTVENGGTFIADGKLYWPAQRYGDDTHAVGIMCLDLNPAHLVSCGFTELGRLFFGPYGTTGLIGGSGIPAADGHYWYADSDGNLDCFDPATGACGRVHVTNTFSFIPSTSATYGKYVLGLISETNAGKYNLYCYDVSQRAICPGYPVDFGAAPGIGAPPGEIAPVLDQAGNLTAACIRSYQYHPGCWGVNGQKLANDPYPLNVGWTGAFAGDALVVGARSYVPVGSDNQVGCYDFSNWDGSGLVPACAGFAPVGNPTFYAARRVDGVPSCLIADGDGPTNNPTHGTINTFDATTGGPCTYATASQTVSPAQYQCGSGAAGFNEWDRLVLSGYPANSYDDAIVTLRDANGDPIPGFTNRKLDYGTTTLDISGLATKAPTNVLTATVVLERVTDAVGIASTRVSLYWKGNPAQICFETVVPQVKCGTQPTVDNSATAVTTPAARRRRHPRRPRSVPAPNSSGITRFMALATPGRCPADLAISKAPSTKTVPPGGRVMYTLTVVNNGAADALGVHVSDTLPAGLSLVSALPTQGKCDTSAGIACDLGDLTSKGAAEILVTADVASNAAAGTLPNVATVSATNPDSNTTNNSARADVDVVLPPVPQPSSDLEIVKKVDRTTAQLGEPLTYTLTVTNKGPDPAADAHITDTSSLNWSVESAKPSQGTCDIGLVLRCALGPLAVGGQATVTVVATVDRAGEQTNGVIVTSPSDDAVPVNNIFRARAAIARIVELRKTVTPRAVHAGGRTTYRVTVTNPNALPLGIVRVCDRLPRGLTFVSSSPRVRSSRSGHCWLIRGMAGGASKHLTLTARAASGASGTVVNRVFARAASTPLARASARIRVLQRTRPTFTG